MSGPMGLVYPTPGNTTNTWGTVLNVLLGLVEAHDHSAGKGVQVPTAGIGINADLGFASFAATAVKALAFTEEAAASVTGYSDALFVNSSDHNLYFRNSSGVNVQVTAGSTLNLSLVGGIGGDYSSVSALVYYDDSTRRYLLEQEVVAGLRPWAGLGTADIDLYEKASSIVNAVKLKSPGALALGYTVTFPAAVPGSTSPVLMSNAGVLSATNTFPNKITFPDYGLSTDQPTTVPAAAADPNSNARTLGAAAKGITAWQFTTNTAVTFPIPFASGDKISHYNVYINKTSDGTKTISARLYTVENDGTETPRGAGTSTNANNPGVVPLTENTVNLTFSTTNVACYLAVDGATGNDLVYSVVYYRSRP
jgi:hypothetical protein